jgi:hypothetical protein
LSRCASGRHPAQARLPTCIKSQCHAISPIITRANESGPAPAALLKYIRLATLLTHTCRDTATVSTTHFRALRPLPQASLDGPGALPGAAIWLVRLVRDCSVCSPHRRGPALAAPIPTLFRPAAGPIQQAATAASRADNLPRFLWCFTWNTHLGLILSPFVAKREHIWLPMDWPQGASGLPEQLARSNGTGSNLSNLATANLRGFRP